MIPLAFFFTERIYMEKETDVLIVGSGPTGLMMGCQLARFGIPFRIIEKQADRAKESRAIGVQAKSMEIFQNLGVAAQFLRLSKKGSGAIFFFGNQPPIEFDFNNVEFEGAPYKYVYLISQPDTEQTLLNLLEQGGGKVERQTELINFKDNGDSLEVEIKHIDHKEIIRCRYIVGCDGAKSKVREILNLTFAGGDYEQEFVLADVMIKWSLPSDKLAIFVSTEGLVAHIPLPNNLNRLILSGIEMREDNQPPSLQTIESFTRAITKQSLNLSDPLWIANFHLHHRAVKQYQKGRAFLAGDAAHIHSPVGGQGMNTGFQDATNLAWKMACVLKYGSSYALLDTYQIERQKIGEILLKSTDRVFGWITSKNPFIIFFRQRVVPHIIRYVVKSQKLRKKAFSFISELGIHYESNEFIVESSSGSDQMFLKGPKAGFRAPDANVGKTTLFEIFREKPFNILVFRNKMRLNESEEQYFSKLLASFPKLIAIHCYEKTAETESAFNNYNVSDSGIYIIRPDGYIGYRCSKIKFEELNCYLNKLLRID